MNAEKTRENRLRRMARQQGLDLEKSRRRDPRALDYGGYQLIARGSNSLVLGELAGNGFSASLDDIEAFLLRARTDRQPARTVSIGHGDAGSSSSAWLSLSGRVTSFCEGRNRRTCWSCRSE